METIPNFVGIFRFLSNFYPITIRYNGAVYASAEHAYQAAKAVFPFDRESIRRASSAAMAKRYSRSMIQRMDLDRLKVMREILQVKFSNPILQKLLLATKDVELVEGNYWHDNFFGACHCDGCEHKTKHNHLGKLLMEIRREIKRDGNNSVV